MRKTLPDVANYFIEIMVPGINEAYAIIPVFKNITMDENLYEGVLSFRAFLVQLYNFLYVKGNDHDSSKKVAHEYENRTKLWK